MTDILCNWYPPKKKEMYNTYAYTQIKEKYGVWETEIEVM